MMSLKHSAIQKTKKSDLVIISPEKNNSIILHSRNVQNQNNGNQQKTGEINKEIIRRLRIQNKKLIEQIVKLKEEIKKTRFNKTQVLNHINDLLKLINQ